MDQSNQNMTSLQNIIRNRRAVKKGYTDKEVTTDVVKELLSDASWAPTHGMREPWRFVFVHQDRLPEFAKKVAQTYPEMLHENREAYLNEPNAILVAIMDEPQQQKQYDENFGAIASLIQNFWLLAWEKGLGVVWKTNPHIYDDSVAEIVGIKDHERIIGFIHLGYFDEEPEVKERTDINHLFSVY